MIPGKGEIIFVTFFGMTCYNDPAISLQAKALGKGGTGTNIRIDNSVIAKACICIAIFQKTDKLKGKCAPGSQDLAIGLKD